LPDLHGRLPPYHGGTLLPELKGQFNHEAKI